MRVGSIVDQPMKDKNISANIKGFWYCLFIEGVQRTIIVYKFAIDTGNTNLVCSNNLLYVLYESSNIPDKIGQFLVDGCISKCAVPWCRMIFLRPVLYFHDEIIKRRVGYLIHYSIISIWDMLHILISDYMHSEGSTNATSGNQFQQYPGHRSWSLYLNNWNKVWYCHCY